MAAQYWNKPPDDFTVYFDIKHLERLNHFEQDRHRGQSEKAPRGAVTVSKEDEVVGTALESAAARAVEGVTRAVEDAAKAVEAVAAKVAEPAAEPAKTFDQTVFFAWPLALRNEHEFTSDSAGREIGEERVTIYRARSLVCPCYNGDACSATLRLDDEWPPRFAVRKIQEEEEEYRTANLEYIGRKGHVDQWRFREDKASIDQPILGLVQPSAVPIPPWKYDPPRKEQRKVIVPGAALPEPEDKRNPFLFSAKQITQVLFPAIYRPETESELDKEIKVIKHGLVVISGQTGTLKSTILRALVQQYLRSFNYRGWGKERYPHVLTVEDPIEKPMVPLDTLNKQEYLHHATRWHINFTPRQLKKDVASLSEALLKDALRQTPAVVIVGETRDRADWKELLRFASTGHLCFTTTHAGSLVETMRTIIEATKSITPDLRSSLIEKIVAVVHLRTFDLVVPTPGSHGEVPPDLGDLESMLLPAVWRNVNGGANFFVSDGLSAILPRRAEGQSLDRPPAGCRGRSDFARSLLNLVLPLSPQEPLPDTLMVRDHVIRIATKADLEGV